MRRWIYIAALALAGFVSAAPTHYIVITIDATKVDEAIPVVPVFLSPADTTFWSTVTGANDVVFYDDTGATALDFYRVAFTDSGTTGTGLFLVNVDGIISASADADFRLYFGDSGATDQSDGTATFTGTNYEAYYVLNTLTDVTGNGNDLTATNGPTSGQTTGIEGLLGYLFDDASTQYLIGSISISAWPVTIYSINSPDTESGQWATTTLGDSADNVDKMRILALGDAANDPYYGYVLGASGAGITMPGTVVNYAANTWYHAAVVQQASSGSSLYVNGSLEDTDATSVNNPAFNQVGIGINASSTRDKPFSGKIAMGYVATAAHSANYISTEYNSWEDGGFLTLAASTTIPTSGSVSGYVQTAASSVDGGDVDWTNQANATGSNTGTYASASLNDEYSYRLELTNADLSALPDSASITSITIDVYHSANGTGRIVDTDVYLMVGGSEFGGNKFKSTAWPTTPAATTYTWTDGVDTMPSVAQVKASTFGISFTVNETNADPREARIHYAYITVNYDAGGGAADTTSFFAFF